MGLVNSCDPEVLALNVKTHMLCYLLVQNLLNYIDGVMVSVLGAYHNSDSPLLRQPITPTVHYSDGPFFRQCKIELNPQILVIGVKRLEHAIRI